MSFANRPQTMNEIFSQISRMQRQQQQVAGPHFAELSTEETWRELLRWIVEDRTGDFATQMVEVAALAAWALESTAEDQPPSSSEDREENEETAWNDEPPLAPVHPRFLWKQPDRFLENPAFRGTVPKHSRAIFLC